LPLKWCRWSRIPALPASLKGRDLPIFHRSKHLNGGVFNDRHNS
jgi:hypothetical protein